MRLQSVPLRAAFVILVGGAIVAFAALRLHSGMAALDRETIAGNAPLLVVTLLLFSCATLLLGAAWIALLLDISPTQPAGRARLLTAFVFAWLGRYIPGTVPFFAGKVYFGQRLGYATRPLVIATGVENVLEVLVPAVVGCVMIACAGGASGHPLVFLAGGAIASAGVLALHPAIFRRLTNRALRALHRDRVAAGAFPSSRSIVVATALVVANQALNGLAFLALLHAIAGLSWGDAALAIGAMSLAGVAGLLIVVAPAGLGVRDGALAALLSSRVAVDAAALSAVMMRLVTVCSDLLLVALALVFDRVTGSNLALHSLRTALGRTPRGHEAPALGTGERAV